MKKKSTVKIKTPYLLLLILFFISSCTNYKQTEENSKPKEKPKIVNIINFIRLLEPRDANITEDVLYQTVVKQIEIMKEYKLGGSFLLQYDALMDSRYQELLKALPVDSFEIGAWWEIPQPLVENSGLQWRGRYPWDWHADVGFSTGYKPQEREKLVDVYMADFKEIFGYYPQSVGSWFIDAHTLNYLYEKYNIVASCNCKDQYGTDGYTLWGGYWNQAYYPSKINSYMPAQNEENQIPVPVFRMLGSDPIRQYDHALGKSRQGVVSLEPVYQYGGGDSTWVNWYLREFVEGEAMEYAYVQTGQENSFTWNAMKKGFEIQIPLIAQLRNENKIKVETLSESGKWFSQNFKTTPATSVTINKDLDGSDLKTVWFNSRFYRMNILWENDNLRIRDIHLFNENFPSDYKEGVATTNECKFFTLPMVDGYLWSTSEKKAGLRLKAILNEEEILIKGGAPDITNPTPGTLFISWPLTSFKGTLILELNEQQATMKIEGNNSIEWYWELTTADNTDLPFEKINADKLDCQFKGMKYSIEVIKGSFLESNGDAVFKIFPIENTLVLNLTANN